MNYTWFEFPKSSEGTSSFRFCLRLFIMAMLGIFDSVITIITLTLIRPRFMLNFAFIAIIKEQTKLEKSRE